MGVFPIIMNILQFWLIDSIVKASTEEPLSLDSDAHDNLDREPLFGAPSDDEDEDVGTQRHDIENPKPHPPHTIARSHSPGKSSGSVTPPGHRAQRFRFYNTHRSRWLLLSAQPL